MRSIVLIPDGNIAFGKLAQALIHGAEVFAIQGNFDDALTMVRKVGETSPVTIVNSINPFRIEGQKTGAFEIVDELGGAPDHHFIPVGNAGNITAYWKGYKEYHAQGRMPTLPKMRGWQAAGAAPLVSGTPVKAPETLATAIRIGNPASWTGAIAARDESGGSIQAVTDEEIVDAYKAVASLEGVFCEPASAASVAGVKKFASANPDFARSKDKVVCILTGHGLKDPDRALAVSPRPASIEASVDVLMRHLKI